MLSVSEGLWVAHLGEWFRGQNPELWAREVNFPAGSAAGTTDGVQGDNGNQYSSLSLSLWPRGVALTRKQPRPIDPHYCTEA